MKKSDIFRKLLSMLLVVCVAVSLCSIAALAEGEVEGEPEETASSTS